MDLLNRLGDLTTEAFRHISTENPLIHMLSRGDQMYLVLQFKIYEAAFVDRENLDPKFEKMERIHKLVEKVGSLENRIRLELFEDSNSEALQFRLSKFQHLPRHLRLFSAVCSAYLGNLGARGHKQKVSIGIPIVEASEFVKLKTGHYYDNHLTDLLQGVLSDEGQQVLDSDFIRKRRERLKTNYPKLYSGAVESAIKAHKAGKEGTGMQSEADLLVLLWNEFDDLP